MIADIFAVDYARADVDVFRYEESEAVASPVSTPPVVKPPKAQKPPKPASVPPPVLSKPNSLGFHESTIKRALETWQPKGSPQQLLKHLEGHQGAKHEAELTGLHDFLKDKPSVSREDVLKHLETHPHQVKMEEHDLEDQMPKWRVVGDDGVNDDEHDSEEEAQARADELNQEAKDQYENDFEIEGGDETHTINTSLLEELEEKEKELGGEMTMEASRALQRLGRQEFNDRGEAEDAISEYIREHLPQLYESDTLGTWEDDDPMIESTPGGYLVSDSPLSRSRHQRHFGTTYDTEEEAKAAIREYIDSNFEDPYSVGESESAKQDTYEDYTLKGPRENYNETHVAIPGVAGNKNPKFLGQGRVTWKDGHGNYSHIDNPVVRLRHDDRETTDGKSMFFVEEIQGPSDTNQEKMPKWVQDRIYDIGLKRALTKAVQGGHDKMGWTTGNQQADRYNLRKAVDRIEWEPPANTNQGALDFEGGMLYATKDGRNVFTKAVSRQDLPEYIGKEVAAKLLGSQPLPRPYNPIFPTAPQNDVHSVEGPDLEVGGRGLKDLYDRELHKRLLEIKVGDKKLKNLGVKIGTSEIPNGEFSVVYDGEVVGTYPDEETAQQNIGVGANIEADVDTVHSIDITPELAVEIKKHGVSLYRRRGEPDRYSRDFMDVIRRMPSQEAAGVAKEMLRLMDLRPEYMRMFSTEEIGYLRGIVGKWS